MKSLLKATSLIIFFNFYSIAYACFHFPKNYKGHVQEGLQEVLLFHDGQNAHMVIRTQLHAKKFPKEIAWVLPFPSLPSKYEEVNGPLFDEIHSLFPVMLGKAEGFGDGAPKGGMMHASASRLKLHDVVAVGGYKIQPIEILKEDAGNEFNTWLKQNKFTPMPFANQKYYLKKGAVFLAIRMDMNFPYGNSLVSKPLHVVYSSDKLTMPMKFTHDNRKFDLDLYIMSKTELKKDLTQAYLEKESSVPYENKHLSPFLDSLIGTQKGFLNRYRAVGLNGPKKLVKKISEDPEFLKTEI